MVDELIGNLDFDILWEIMRFLEDINKRGIIVFVVIYVKEIVDSMRKRVVVIDCGRIVKD